MNLRDIGIETLKEVMSTGTFLTNDVIKRNLLDGSFLRSFSLFHKLSNDDKLTLLDSELVIRHKSIKDKIDNWHFLVEDYYVSPIDKAFTIRNAVDSSIKRDDIIFMMSYSSDDLIRSGEFYVPTILEEMELACTKR